jgi:TolB-like protein/Tfp pilus assembly protein PilF
MSSIIEGYNYDIFISYRQKDNKGDHWVSAFVEALKTELESTFKEEISVYFDINPHDGLLETHDVDASLKEKLKCVIFIPIISRTYCDPKSYAWEHEFKAFLEMASNDPIGLLIKLPNTNVATRVLPIRIHDLEEDDIRAYETALGSVLRGIEFIYKEHGVNKPLKPGDDEKKNLNRTQYNIQINRTANAIREIMRGLKGDPLTPLKGYLTEQPLNRKKSIIVLPFENLSPDTGQEYFSDGLTEEIIADLSCITDLLVISRSSAMTFKKTSKTIPEIAKSVNVRYVLEGSVRKADKNIRITAQLIDSENDGHLWSERYNGTLDNIFEIQENVARSITEALKLNLKTQERERTDNFKSYDLYLLGRFYWNKRSEEGVKKSIEYFEQAISFDKNFAPAYAGLADAYMVAADWCYLPPEMAVRRSYEYVKKALSLDGSIAEIHATLGCLTSIYKYDQSGAEMHFLKSISLNPNYASAYQWYALSQAISGNFEKGISIISQALKVDPLSPIINYAAGLIYYHSGSYDNAIQLMKRTSSLNPEFSLPNLLSFLCHMQKGDHFDAVKAYTEDFKRTFGSVNSEIDKILRLSSTNFIDSIITLELKYNTGKRKSFRRLALLYSLNKDEDNALDCLEKSVNNFETDFMYLNVEPAYRNLHNNPRFRALAAKLGL